MAIEIIPTCVPADAAALRAGADIVGTFARTIHVDVDDGKFAPVTTWPYAAPGEWKEFTLPAVQGVQTEIHLMVEDPREIGIAFARTSAYRIYGHVEAFDSAEAAHGALDAWRENGASEAGLGLLMATPFELIEPLLPACDAIHMMSIASIGTQGIPYDTRAPERIAEFHRRNPSATISVDGGVSKDNIAELVRAGATRFGVGSAIFKAEDPVSAYQELRSLAESALQ